MSEQRTDITKDLQELFQKTAEANKVFLTESAKFVSQMAKGKLQAGKLASVQQGLLTDAFTTYVKLGLQYTSSLVDLGLAFTKRLNEELKTDDNNGVKDESNEQQKPSFILQATASPGSIAKTEFILDSDKNEPVVCYLKQSVYTLQDDAAIITEFKTEFSPQSFQLLQGEPQKVDISIYIPAEAKQGIYVSHIKVEGYEHIFFSLYLNVVAQDLNMPSE